MLESEKQKTDVIFSLGRRWYEKATLTREKGTSSHSSSTDTVAAVSNVPVWELTEEGRGGVNRIK